MKLILILTLLIHLAYINLLHAEIENEFACLYLLNLTDIKEDEAKSLFSFLSKNKITYSDFKNKWTDEIKIEIQNRCKHREVSLACELKEFFIYQKLKLFKEWPERRAQTLRNHLLHTGYLAVESMNPFTAIITQSNKNLTRSIKRVNEKISHKLISKQLNKEQRNKIENFFKLVFTHNTLNKIEKNEFPLVSSKILGDFKNFCV